MKLNKPDEMEMYIAFQSMKFAYIFVVIALIVWLWIDFTRSGELPLVPFIIMSIQNLIFFGSKIYMTRKMSSFKKGG